MRKYHCNVFNRGCTGTGNAYKMEGGPGLYDSLLTWRVLRWALIPSAILAALALLVYFSVDSSENESLNILTNDYFEEHIKKNPHLVSLEGEEISLDETFATYHVPKSDSEQNSTVKHEEQDLSIFEVLPEGHIDITAADGEQEDDDDFDTSESKPATLSNRRLISGKPYVHISTTIRTTGPGLRTGDKNFVDKLISSFDLSAKRGQGQGQGQGQGVRSSTARVYSTPSGLLNKKIPNGHKYGEYQVPTKETFTQPPRVSPTLPSSNPTLHVVSMSTVEKPRNETESVCSSPSLSMCRGVLPWDLTATPIIPGVTSAVDLDAVMPYFEMIASTNCSPRIRQFLCSLLEPECRSVGYSILPPCRKPCRAVEEECRDFILDSLDLSQVFNCEIYPDSNDSEECVNLGKGDKCNKNEFRCADGTCIPWRWACNGNRDCQLGEDETNCTVCTQEEFRCTADHKCIPLDWKCDRRKDCSDGADEFNCQAAEVSVPHSHVSPCPSGELRCVDGRCITLSQICDNVNDCSDGADETNCSPPNT